MPTIEAAGGRYLVRGNLPKTYEAGKQGRVVVIVFGSLVADASQAKSLPSDISDFVMHLSEGLDKTFSCSSCGARTPRPYERRQHGIRAA